MLPSVIPANITREQAVRTEMFRQASVVLARQERELMAKRVARKITIIKLREQECLGPDDYAKLLKFEKIVTALQNKRQYTHRNRNQAAAENISDSASLVSAVNLESVSICNNVECCCGIHFGDQYCLDEACSCIDHYKAHACHPDNPDCRLFPAPKGHPDYNAKCSNWENMPHGLVVCLASGKHMSRHVHVCHAACSFIVNHPRRGVYCSKSGRIIDDMVLVTNIFSGAGVSEDNNDRDCIPEESTTKPESSQTCVDTHPSSSGRSRRSGIESALRAKSYNRKRKAETEKQIVLSRLTRDYIGPKYIPRQSAAEKRLLAKQTELEEEAEKKARLEMGLSATVAEFETKSNHSENENEEQECDTDCDDEEESVDDDINNEKENSVPVAETGEEDKVANGGQTLDVAINESFVGRRMLMQWLKHNNFGNNCDPVKWRTLNNVSYSSRDSIRIRLKGIITSLIKNLLADADTFGDGNLNELVVVCGHNYIHMRQLHEDEVLRKKEADMKKQFLEEAVGNTDMQSIGSSSPSAPPSQSSTFFTMNPSFKDQDAKTSNGNSNSNNHSHSFSVEHCVAATIVLLCNPHSSVTSYAFMTDANFKPVSQWKRIVRLTTNAVNNYAFKLQNALMSLKFPAHVPFSVNNIPMNVPNCSQWTDLLNYSLKLCR